MTRRTAWLCKIAALESLCRCVSLSLDIASFCSRCRSKTHGLGKNRGFRPQLEVRCEEIRRGSVLVAGRICFLSFMGSMGSQRRDSTQRFGYRHRSAEPQCTSTSVLRVSMEIPRGVQRCGSAVDVCFAHCFCSKGILGSRDQVHVLFCKSRLLLEMFEVHEFSNLFQASLAT